MSRGSKKGSKIFTNTLLDSEQELWHAWTKATRFGHTVIRGDERELGVRNFLSDKLPDTYKVVKGEAVDFKDNRTNQLDIMIYDHIRNAPLAADSGRNQPPIPAKVGHQFR